MGQQVDEVVDLRGDGDWSEFSKIIVCGGQQKFPNNLGSFGMEGNVGKVSVLLRCLLHWTVQK